MTRPERDGSQDPERDRHIADVLAKSTSLLARAAGMRAASRLSLEELHAIRGHARDARVRAILVAMETTVVGSPESLGYVDELMALELEGFSDEPWDPPR